MPYKDRDRQREFCRLWWRKKQMARFKKLSCIDCGQKDIAKLTFGQFVLCVSCLRKRQKAPLKKSLEYRRLNTYKKKIKNRMRKIYGLQHGAPIADANAFMWVGKLDEAIALKMITKKEAAIATGRINKYAG